MGVFSVLLSHGLSEYRYEKRRGFESEPLPPGEVTAVAKACVAVLAVAAVLVLAVAVSPWFLAPVGAPFLFKALKG